MRYIVPIEILTRDLLDDGRREEGIARLGDEAPRARRMPTWRLAAAEAAFMIRQAADGIGDPR